MASTNGNNGSNSNNNGNGFFKLDPAHASFKWWEDSLSQEVWAEKYRYKEEANIFASMERVADAIMKGNEGIHRDVALEAMHKGLWMPAGRIMTGAGTDNIVTLMNCFHGKERFLTAEYGAITFERAYNLVGELRTLGKHGWSQATIRKFGVQDLNEVTFAPRSWRGGKSKLRHTIRVTPNHRWILSNGLQTTNLAVGQRVLGITDKNLRSEGFAAGWVHGFVYGDGHLSRTTSDHHNTQYPAGTRHYDIRLCGNKVQFLQALREDPRFKSVTTPQVAGGDPIVNLSCMEDLKDVPQAPYEPDYIQGFIEGYDAADGDTSCRTPERCQIFSKDYDGLGWLAENAPLGGYICTGLKEYSSGRTNYGGRTPLYVIRLTRTEVEWEVVSIKPSELDSVYCAIVPGEAAFTLANGIYTGNCYVNETVEDSMVGITRAFNNTLFTLQQGGGMGTDFSPLRPKRAVLGRYGNGAAASGPIPFMKMWSAGSDTIRSVGGRNGAMMGTLCDTHPDLLDFVRAKQTKGVMEAFNVSILVSDAFIHAIEDDEEWTLYFHIPPMDDPSAETFQDDAGVTQYIYTKHSARALWEEITRSTYEYSEPGVIFIDRINDLNNLQYCEEIRTTNPCGEQPLGPDDACDLGHYNLARMVKNPFSPRARFDFDLLARAVEIGQRFLDNVIDNTRYPLPQQKEKHHQTRRTGGGFTGLATVFVQLGMRYGSIESVRLTERIMQTIALESYRTSVELAKEKGSFPLFDKEQYFQGFAGRTLPKDLQDDIREHGIRNGVLNTVAPTGTMSVAYGDVESGCEPIFAYEYDRRRRNKNNEWETYTREAYALRFYRHVKGDPSITKDDLPDHFVTAQELTVADHIAIQAAAQKWVDASISKTINLPKETTYEDFVQVYTLAYHAGCKGCTTYRPSDIRGSILSTKQEEIGNTSISPVPQGRPPVLAGTTYKIKWPSMSSAMYITINGEIFFASKDARYAEWMTALTLMISAIFRSHEDPAFVPRELKQVVSANDQAWINGTHYNSLVAYIGSVIEGHITGLRVPDVPIAPLPVDAPAPTPAPSEPLRGDICPSCGHPTLFMMEGCAKCAHCTYSKC
jgi:ribonucleoside-diphosphate reductase alpha chain